ncbi:sugar nucleotide-binding protein [Pacificispira sp.]|uniref:sugar nucleotide-binding protein n=1 Tax=Pacificispira sp. TaxID=2888761 RepID=UPI003BA90DC1
MTREIDLVVGAGGKVGAALAGALRRQGATVVTTGRAGSVASDVTFDLDKPDYAILPENVARAYICAAMPGADACAADPEKAFRVNVTTPVELTRRLAARGAFVVNISSTQIFDGNRPAVSPGTQHSPYSEYGRHKSALEERLRTLPGTPGAIVRISKILSPNDPGILSKWRDELAQGRAVSAFRDRAMSPVSLRQAVDALVAVAYGRWSGVSQVSASDEISYLDAALAVARIARANPELVRSVSADDAVGTVPPRHAGLDCDATETRLGWRFARSVQVVKEALGAEQ